MPDGYRTTDWEGRPIIVTGTTPMTNGPRSRPLHETKVTRAGWFNFEGLGRPFEGWAHIADERGVAWITAGRALTWMGARRKARRKLAALKEQRVRNPVEQGPRHG